MRDGVATRLRPLLTRIFGADPPIRVLAWDGSEFGPAHAPCFVIKDRRALRRLLWKPGELGLARAFIAGELGIEGDFVAALAAVQEVMRLRGGPIRLSSDEKREIVRMAVMLGAVGPEPRPPAEEHTWVRAMARPGAGAPVDPAVPPRRARWPRDAMAAHADELGSAFFEHLLGPELTPTCGSWAAGHRSGHVSGAHASAGPDPQSLAAAQRAGFERIAARLGLAAGMRVLDAACGWGSFALYAAANFGVHVVGHTTSPEQARVAVQRARRAGLADRVEIVVSGGPADYDTVRAPEPAGYAAAAPGAGDGADAGDPYDAAVVLAATELSAREVAALHPLLRPGGRLLTRQLNRPAGSGGGVRRTFTSRYIFAGDGRPGPLGAAVLQLEEAGFEVRDVHALREDYARTLREWTANLQANWDDCVALTSAGRCRVWLLYLAATALACEGGRLGLHEVLSIRPEGADYVSFPAAGRVDVHA